MNADKLTLLLATLLLMLRAAEGEELREGPAYAAMGKCTLDEFQTVLAVSETMGMVKREANFLVKITCKGRTLAYKLQQALEPVS